MITDERLQEIAASAEGWPRDVGQLAVHASELVEEAVTQAARVAELVAEIRQQRKEIARLREALRNLADDAVNHHDGDDRSMTLNVTVARALAALEAVEPMIAAEAEKAGFKRGYDQGFREGIGAGPVKEPGDA